MARFFSDVLRQDNAVITPCGHSFSESHLRRWLRQNSNCPRCKARVAASSLVPNFALRDVVSALHRCALQGSGESALELMGKQQQQQQQVGGAGVPEGWTVVDADEPYEEKGRR